MIYTLAASLTQPFFGILADRLRGRWVSAAGLLWTGSFFALIPFMHSYPALVTCLTIGALGSGAFHPSGMVNAAASGGRFPTTATSIFFVLGQSGLALGPIISGILLQTLGVNGLPYMALAVSPAFIFMLYLLHAPILEDGHHIEPMPVHSHQHQPAGGNAKQPANKGAYVAVAFMLLIALRATTLQSFATLLPKFFADLGYEPAVYGAMIGLFGLAGATGTFIGGYLGDRFNRRLVIFSAMLFSVPFAYLVLNTQGPLFFVVAVLAGICLNIPHSILLVMAQRLLPKRKGMIGGAVLGFMFASGAATAWLASWCADWAGLPTVLNIVTLMPVGAGLCALLLPSTRGSIVEPAPAPAPSAGD